MPKVKITECPRDAMQGINTFIPTDEKVKYLNALLKVGYDILDFGSFVSPKAIPQMKDTKDVIPKLQLEDTSTKLLAIVANERGASEAATFDEITYLGYPFSISPTFLKKNIKATLEEAFQTGINIHSICQKNNKEMVTYVSMAFGNPYEDEWDVELLIQWITKLYHGGIAMISLADTVGVASAERIGYCFDICQKEFPQIEFGLHLHSTLENVREKLSASYKNGCRRFDAVLDGLGGCPMAGTELVGNINTDILIEFLHEMEEPVELNMEAYQSAKNSVPYYF